MRMRVAGRFRELVVGNVGRAVIVCHISLSVGAYLVLIYGFSQAHFGQQNVTCCRLKRSRYWWVSKPPRAYARFIFCGPVPLRRPLMTPSFPVFTSRTQYRDTSSTSYLLEIMS